jgi:pyridoxal phosphate enzyme (YggS family)
MHNTVQNLIEITDEIKLNLRDSNIVNLPKIIAVSKTFKIDKILPLIDYGHIDFGENKIQEAVDKWTKIKSKYSNIKLHMIGKLQTNKVKFAVKLFDYIHSVDSEKLAKKIADEQKKIDKKIKIFIQVNIGNEEQKSGVNKVSLPNLYSYCKKLSLDVIGLMCIPPQDKSAEYYFKELNSLNKDFDLNELSMGMSADFIDAVKNSATYLRIGSTIFGKRS